MLGFGYCLMVSWHFCFQHFCHPRFSQSTHLKGAIWRFIVQNKWLDLLEKGPGFPFNYILGRAVVLQVCEVGNSEGPQPTFVAICYIEAISDFKVWVDCCCSNAKYLGPSVIVTPVVIILSFIAVTPDCIHLGIISLCAGIQLPASNAMSNGPVAGGTSLMQAFPNVGSQPATNATLLPPSVGSAQRLSAPLSPGVALSNGPSSQHPLSAVSNSTQGGFSQPGSAFTPVMSSQLSHPSLPLGATGTPMQRQLNANLQAQQSQLGQNASPPQSSLPTGQDESPPPQTSGMFPTSAPQGPQPLSALHSNKPKRPVMPMNTGYPGQQGSPSPRSTPPPPVGVRGSAPAGRSTPPPSSNLPVSSMPPVSYNSPVTGLATTSQDSPTGTRPISSRRRMYPAQVIC